jgi:tyrosine-protein kinase Etk/Wzc
MQQTESQQPAIPRDADTINLLDYAEVLVKHKRLIIRTTLSALVVSVAVALCLPRIYTSTALILPPQQDQGVMGLMLGQMSGGISSLAGDLLGKGSSADMYAKMLESETVRDAIIDRFSLISTEKTKYRTFAYKLLERKVQIDLGKKDGIISITAEDKDPKRAAEIANAYVDELGKLTVGLSVTGAGGNRKFLEGRLTKAKADLAQAEDALKAFASKTKALDPVEQAKGTLEGVGALEGQLAAEQVKLGGIRRIFTDSSQEVKNEQAVIANLKGQIAKFEGERTGSAIPGLGSVPGMSEQYLRLMREFKIQEALVEVLTKQYEMAKLSEAKDNATLQVIQWAKPQDKSLKPSKTNIVLLSTLAAFVASVFFSFVIEGGRAMPLEERQKLQRLMSSLLGPRLGRK